MTALRALLNDIVDYAGLFPPAALDMPAAVRNYAQYRSDDDAWMLGRFVVPAARLDEFRAARDAVVSDEWRLTALLGADPAADLDRVRAFNQAERGRARIDSLEVKLDTPGSVAHVAALVAGELELFVELPIEGDLSALVAAVRAAGVRAKIRTGGVVASAVPSPDAVVRFIRVCLDAGVAFKATAGLHHPLRAEYRLTYDAGSPTGVMFGYLNVFLAAAFMANGVPDRDAVRLLEERDASAFEVTEQGIRWRDAFLTAAQLEQARERVATSFGSCSFREPVDELHSLALM